jgi:hypothetical protein
VVHRRVGTAELVGRADELGVLSGVVRQIGDPAAPTCVLLTGEAGVGKSRLLSALADNVAGGHVRVLRGACLELSEALPYGPFTDVLNELVTEDGVHAVREFAGPWVGELSAMTPDLDAAGSQAGDAPGDRHHLFQAVATVLAGLARQRPTVVLIEDMQWADQSTVDLFNFLVYRAAATRVLFVATVRDEGMRDDDPVHAMIASHCGRPRVEHPAKARCLQPSPSGRHRTSTADDTRRLTRSVTPPVVAVHVEAWWLTITRRQVARSPKQGRHRPPTPSGTEPPHEWR